MEIKRDGRGWIVGNYGYDCFAYREHLYGVGTVVELDYTTYGKQTGIFIGNNTFRLSNNTTFQISYSTNISSLNYIHIIQPVYYNPPSPQPVKQAPFWLRTGSGSQDAHNEVSLGFIWYILAMLLGIIFIDKILIWIGATTIYFAWKGKK